jgi:hypothetical protein
LAIHDYLKAFIVAGIKAYLKTRPKVKFITGILRNDILTFHAPELLIRKDALGNLM